MGVLQEFSRDLVDRLLGVHVTIYFRVRVVVERITSRGNRFQHSSNAPTLMYCAPLALLV